MREKEIREGLAKLTKERAKILYWIFQGKKTNWIADNVLQRTQHDYGYHITEIYETLGYPKDKKTHWTIKRERLISEVYPIFSEYVKNENDLENWQDIRFNYIKSIPPKEQSSIPEQPEIFIRDETPTNGQKQQDETPRPKQPQRKTSRPLVLLGFGAGALISCIVIGVIFTVLNRPASPMTAFTKTTTPQIIINPTPTLPSNLLFYDNFDNGISPQWEQIVGTFASVNGRLSVIEGQPFLFRGSDLAVMKIGDNSWKRYIVDALMYDNDSWSGNSACRGNGIGVTVTNLNNMLFFNLSVGIYSWWEIIEDSECMRIENSYNYKYDNADLLRVRLIVDNGKFTAYINENKSSEIILDKDKFKSGGVILVSKKNMEWDNFLIYPIP